MSAPPDARVLRQPALCGRALLGRPASASPAAARDAHGTDAPGGASSPPPVPDPAHVEAAVQEKWLQRQAELELAFEARLQAARQEAQQAAEQAAQAAVDQRLHALDQLLRAVPAQIQARLEAVQDDIAALCLDLACELLGPAALQPAALHAQVGAALHRWGPARPLAVHLHPHDLARLDDAAANGERPGGAGITWVASERVALGGCLLESSEGGLDARFETRLALLRDTLRQAREEAPRAHTPLHGGGA